MKKKILSILILSMFCLSNAELITFADTPYQGHIEETNIAPKNEEDNIFTKEETKIEQNKVINLTVAQVLSNTTSMEGV